MEKTCYRPPCDNILSISTSPANLDSILTTTDSLNNFITQESITATFTDSFKEKSDQKIKDLNNKINDQHGKYEWLAGKWNPVS